MSGKNKSGKRTRKRPRLDSDLQDRHFSPEFNTSSQLSSAVNTSGYDPSLSAVECSPQDSPFKTLLFNSTKSVGFKNNNASTRAPQSDLSHQGKSSQCPAFARKSSISTVNFASSSGDQPTFECVYCKDGQLRDEVSLKFHRQDYHRMRYETCMLPIDHDVNNEDSMTESSSEEDAEDEKKHVCPDCGNEKKTYGEVLSCIQKHMKENKENVHVCNICQKDCKDRKALNQHKNRQAFIIVIKSKGQDKLHSSIN